MVACSPPHGEDDGVMHVKALFLCGLLTNLSYWQLRLFDRYLGTTTLYESSYKLQILKKFLWCANAVYTAQILIMKSVLDWALLLKPVTPSKFLGCSCTHAALCALCLEKGD